MGLRLLRREDDPILRKHSKPVTEITDRMKTLGQDLVDTLNYLDGLGLASPQVGVLRRMVVVKHFLDYDAEEPKEEEIIIAVNPEIISQEGEDIRREGCLSFPGRNGKVKRPEKITVTYTDLDNNTVTRDFEGMTARCFCHEIDHLDGIVYLDKVIEGTLEYFDEED